MLNNRRSRGLHPARRPRRGRRTTGPPAAAVPASSRANDTPRPEPEPSISNLTPSKPSTATEHLTVQAAGTTFAVDLRGDGPAVLVIHGGGEDAAMLAPLAERLAAAGHRVMTYDRRGTGGSGRHDWPGSGASQHADDAAALLRALHVGRAQVVGLSSGGVIALDLAVRHPPVVSKTFVWEPPAVGVLPGGEALNAEITAPIERYLAVHPGDFVGAQAMLLSAILAFEVTVDDPRFAATRANAEPMIRDEPAITLRAFGPHELADLDVTIAVGTAPNEIVEAASQRLGQLTGRAPLVVHTDDHEVYLNDPGTLADLLTSRR